jgi:hypothetical protein
MGSSYEFIKIISGIVKGMVNNLAYFKLAELFNAIG